MKTRDILRRAGTNLAQAKGRTLLTSLAIGVGAFTITLAMAAGAGGRNYVNDIANTAGDARAMSVYAKQDGAQAEQPALEEFGVQKDTSGQSRGVLVDKDIQTLKDIEGVESVVPQYYVESQYITRGENEKKFIAPLSVRVDKTELKLSAGELPGGDIVPGTVVIAEKYLKQLGFTDAQSAIGKKLVLHIVPEVTESNPLPSSGKDEVFTIGAVDTETDTTVYYLPSVHISAQDAARMYEYQRGGLTNAEYYGASVRVAPGFDVKAVQSVIEEKYEAYSFEEDKESILQVIAIAQWGMAGFGALAILASIFGIINTQYISVLERTQQIGLMKALGMRSRDIGRLFRYEAAWVGFLGGILGAGLALIAAPFNSVISTTLGLDKSVSLLAFEPISIITLIASLTLVSIAAGYFPSRKAAKLDPIEALRTE